MTLFLAWVGGLALAFLLLSSVIKRFQRLLAAWKRQKALKKAVKLDWSLIDSTVNSDRIRRDCERQESLGICTGRECQVYDSCDFNIKKIVN
jgi:hypothetical protein